MRRLEEGSSSVGRPGQDTVRQQQEQLRPHREQRIGGVGEHQRTNTTTAAANPPPRRPGLSTARLQASKLGPDRPPLDGAISGLK